MVRLSGLEAFRFVRCHRDLPRTCKGPSLETRQMMLGGNLGPVICCQYGEVCERGEGVLGGPGQRGGVPPMQMMSNSLSSTWEAIVVGFRVELEHCWTGCGNSEIKKRCGLGRSLELKRAQVDVESSFAFYSLATGQGLGVEISSLACVLWVNEAAVLQLTDSNDWSRGSRTLG
jgi:hypothetical protein